MREFAQLTQTERYQIQALLQAGLSQNAIARQLHRSQSSISRELARNASHTGYQAAQAEQLCRQRHARKSKRCKSWAMLDEWVTQRLHLGWTPQRIASESCQQPPFGVTVSHEWIYLRLRDDARAGGQLWRCLPRGRKQRTPRLPRTGKHGGIRNRASITERPAVVAERSRIGDWEIDTVVSAGKQSAVVTVVERRSRLYLTRFVADRGTQAVSRALIELLGQYAARGQVLTLTADNGREFAGHEQVAIALGCKVYFADPYSSYQRGSNEHHNGLLRRFFPKGTDFARIPESDLKAATAIINLWPRKNLNWRRPIDIMHPEPIQ